MPTSLTPKERGVLLALMAAGRPVPNPELREQFKLDLKKVQRDKLRRAELIRVGKAKRQGTGRSVLTLSLSDEGWRWASEELSAAVPDGTMGLGALYAVLNGLHRHLQRQGLKPRDAFEVTNGSMPSITAQIEQAYTSLARAPRDWIRLADLRAHLPAIPRSEVDAALWSLYHARSINMHPEENAKTLSEADHAAALRLGDTDVHLLRMR